MQRMHSSTGAAEPQQLDIFADSRSVVLRNDLIAAVVVRNVAAARAAFDVLRREFADDVALGPAQRLIEAAAAHPAALYLRAATWAQAAQAVERIASWHRIARPLAWMVQARWRVRGSDAAWPLLAQACWLAPRQVPALIGEIGDARLTALAARFENTFDGADAEWDALPAWALIEQPLLMDAVSTAQVPPQQPAADAFATVLALLRLERQGRHHDIVDKRRHLRELSAPLFAQYMKTR